MTLRVIGAGLGRTGTLSLKLALEYIGFGPCYHAMEIAASARRSLPMWNDAIGGNADWDAIFDGYASTTDYPGCCFWTALMDHFPDAKIILSVRDANSWFESVNETIFAPRRGASLFQADGEQLSNFLRRDFGERIAERAFMTDYFNCWNQRVIDTVPAERLLVFSVGEGWAPLCEFLGVPVPDAPYPRVHERGGGSVQMRAPPSDLAKLEVRMRTVLDGLHRSAF